MENIIRFIHCWEKYLVYEVCGTKCWQVTLRFNCHNNSLFFSRQERISYFQISYTEWLATFISKYPDRVYFYIYASICHFNFLFYFSFGNDIFHILPDFSANIFLLPYQVCKQSILPFQTMQTMFFNIAHPPCPPPGK